MAVFTEVSNTEARELLRRLQLGELVELRGIEGGIENTNYFLTSDQGEFVLTLFERLTAAQLPFYLYLMKHLAHGGVPVPDPRADKNGDILHTVCGKPAAVVNKLRGKSQLAPQGVHCAAAGTRRGVGLTGTSPTCAACPGGTKPCPWCYPTSIRPRPPCCGPSWPTRTMWRPAQRMPHCPGAPCTPTCSATT